MYTGRKIDIDRIQIDIYPKLIPPYEVTPGQDMQYLNCQVTWAHTRNFPSMGSATERFYRDSESERGGERQGGRERASAIYREKRWGRELIIGEEKCAK